MTVNNSWCSLVSWCACIDIMFTWKCKPMFSYFSYMYILPVLMHGLVECLTLHANSPDVTSIPNPFLENRLPKKNIKIKTGLFFFGWPLKSVYTTHAAKFVRFHQFEHEQMEPQPRVRAQISCMVFQTDPSSKIDIGILEFKCDGFGSQFMV